MKPIGDRGDFRDQVARPVRMRVVVGVADVEHRVQQLFLGVEVMQQAGGADAGFAGDLGKGRVAPPVTGQQPLRNGQDPLLAVFAFQPQESYGRVWAPGSFVQPT